MSNKETKKDVIIFCVMALAAWLGWCWVNRYTGISQLINFDDVASLQFAMSGDGLGSKLMSIVQKDPTNVPLFYFLLYFWICLFGYEPAMLRLLPQVLGAASIVIIGIIGCRIKDTRLGVICAALMMFPIQIMFAAFQLRAYPLLIFNSSLLILFWLKRDGSIKKEIIYAVGMLLLSFSHFFGVLLCFAFGLWDLAKVISGNKKFKLLLPYVIFCVIFVPYLAASFIIAKNMYGSFWPPVPSYFDLPKMLYALVPIGLIGLFLLAYTTFRRIILKVKDKKLFNENGEIVDLCILGIAVTIAIAFVYSKYINPESSVWVFRYFLTLFPCTVLIVGYGINEIIELFKLQKPCIDSLLAAFFCVMIFYNVDYSIENVGEISIGGKPFYEASEHLRSEPSAFSETSIIYYPAPYEYSDGLKILLNRNNDTSNPNFLINLSQLETADLTNVDTLYTVGLVYDISAQELGYIEEYFELSEQNCGGVENLNKYSRRIDQ